MADCLSEALATDDPEFICDALDTIARAEGMTQIAGLGSLPNPLTKTR
nr:hypothetical protein [Bradyrhizobium sp. 170]